MTSPSPHLDSSPHQTAVPLPTPHPSIPPQFPPKIPTHKPTGSVRFVRASIFTTTLTSAIPASHLQPLYQTTSQAKTSPRPPFHPCPGLAQAERRRRPPRQQRKQSAHNNRIRLKRGGRGGRGAGRPLHTSETRMVSDTTSAKHGTCPCPPFISSP